ncbi:MAG: hypothetical protein Q4D61_09205 [Cardiobacteriaceae bacterium]|nr:hypothetical protein [Cardiobacteriaceae bacterium]
MNKKWRDGLLAAAALAVVGGLFFWSRQTTPEQVAAVLFDMNVPARYVFIGDTNASRLASVDIESGALVGELPLQAVPRLLAVNKHHGLLAYADESARQIFVRNLATHAEQVFALPHEAAGMTFDSDTPRLFVHGATAFSQLDVSSASLQTFDGFSVLRSLHVEPLTRDIVLLDGGAREIKHISLYENEISTFPLPQGWQDFTASALSPGGDYLLFGVYDAVQAQHLGVVWRSDDQSWQTYPMAAPLLQPVTDNNATALFFLDKSGQGLRIDAADFANVRPFATAEKPSRLALGWLDQHLLVAGENALYLLDSATLQPLAQTPFPGAAHDIFITADSKTALLTAQGSRDLLLYDMRDGGAVRAVALGEAAQPGAVRMGAGYTLCH